MKFLNVHSGEYYTFEKETTFFKKKKTKKKQLVENHGKRRSSNFVKWEFWKVGQVKLFLVKHQHFFFYRRFISDVFFKKILRKKTFVA